MSEIKVGIRLDALPGVTSGTTQLRRALTVAATLGASCVELCGPKLFPHSELSDTGLRSLRKMLDDLNLRVAAIRFPTRRGYDQLEDLDRRVDATKAAMSLAYRLGASVVINQIGTIPEEVTDPRYQTLKAVIEDLGRHGARVGAFFAAETGSESPQRLAGLLDQTLSGHVSVAFNPGLLIIHRHDVAASLRLLRNRIEIVCAVDGVIDLAAGRGLTVPVGQGTTDFPNLIGQLEDIPYRGPYIVGRQEMEPATVIEELRQSVQYLKNL